MSAMMSLWLDRIVRPILPSRKAAAPTAFKRAIGRQAARARNGGRRLFSAAAERSIATRLRRAELLRLPALHREAK